MNIKTNTLVKEVKEFYLSSDIDKYKAFMLKCEKYNISDDDSYFEFMFVDKLNESVSEKTKPSPKLKKELMEKVDNIILKEMNAMSAGSISFAPVKMGEEDKDDMLTTILRRLEGGYEKKANQ